MSKQSTTSDTLSSDADKASSQSVAGNDLLEEYDLEDSQVLRHALSDLELQSPVAKRALRTYLSKKSEKKNAESVLRRIEEDEALEVSETLVRREIQQTAARVQLQKAQDNLERARRETKAASDHLMRVLSRTGHLPSDKECGVDAARGTIHELPFDGRQSLLELALQLFQMDASKLSLIEEHEGELFPESMRENLSRIERDAPDLMAREFLTDLASLLLELSEPGRRIVISMVKRPDAAGGLAGTEELPEPLAFLVHLSLHAAAN